MEKTEILMDVDDLEPDVYKPRIMVLFYSMYGHVFEMVKACQKGISDEDGIPRVMKVAELTPRKYLNDAAIEAKGRMSNIPEADPRQDLKGIDGIIVATPTRYGNMCSQMENFWDQTGGDWEAGTLIDKPGGVIVSTANQHGGQETTIFSVMKTLLHHGCIIVGLPYSNKEQVGIDEVTGGTPYGPTTIAGMKGERMPSAPEERMGYALGKRVTKMARKLSMGKGT